MAWHAMPVCPYLDVLKVNDLEAEALGGPDGVNAIFDFVRCELQMDAGLVTGLGKANASRHCNQHGVP